MNTKPTILLVIDPQVQDYQQLISDIQPGVQLLILDPNRDGIEQITEILSSSHPTPKKGEEMGARHSLHIISHGSPGTLYLGNTTLNPENLEQYSPQIQQWGKYLTEKAEILLYGCDVAARETGLGFIQHLSSLTGANIAASTNKTGNIALGGDWELEAQTGNIETPIAITPRVQQTYQGILSGDLVWAKGMGGSDFDYGKSIAIDSSGNIYTTGYFRGTADFDPGPGVANLTSAGSNDIFISKLDANGNYLWAKQFGGSNGYDIGYSIAVDSSGNTYTTGSFSDTVDFDPGAGTANLTSAGGEDIFISKLDANGNYLWAKNLGGGSDDEGNSIAVDSSGNTYITGKFYGTADFDPGAGVVNLASAGHWDIFITKLDVNGNYVWAKNLGGGNYDWGNSIAVDSSGNTYTTGYFEGTADFDPGSGTVNLTSVGSSDIFISKLNADGTLAWAKQIGGSAGDDGRSIAVDSSGNTYTTGIFNGIVDFDPGAGTFSLGSVGAWDIFISKLNADGTFAWAKQMGGNAGDDGNGIALDSSGNIYATGYFDATADFDPGPGVASFTSAGSIDTFITKLDTNGNYIWAKNPRGSSGDAGNSIAVDSSGNIYTTGYFEGTVDFDPNTGVTNLTSAGFSDIFIVKLSESPTVTNITSTTTNGTYGIGTVIPITVTFSETVTVIGAPTLTLNNGANATYASGSGTNTLTFNYTVAAGNNTADLDYSSTTALALNGGTIRNTGNTTDATLTLPTPGATNSLGANKNLIIDGIAPTVTINQAVGQTDPATTSPINYTVTFSEAVTGFNAADISFTGSTASGTLTPTITGSGTTYNVAVSGMTSSGTVVPTIIANAATDTAGNNNTASTSTDNTVTYNTIPTVSNISKTGNEDSNITFTAADFTAVFSDVDNDSLNKIKITTLPANGTLQLSGTNVTLNQEILLASIPNLTFTPTADYNGSSSFTWNGSDGSNYATSNATANLTINSVNDQPSFTATTPPTVNEDAAAITLTNWATFNPGPANEASQTATYTVSSISNPGLFATAPTVNSSGTLTYTPATDANGTSTFNVVVQDNGGTANSGVDTSTVQTFTITVDPINDAPSFTNAGNQTLTTWTNTAQTVSGWANNFVVGPTNENTQAVADFLVTVTSGNTLFTTLPDIDNNGTLTYTPTGETGTATVQVQLKDDGGIANGGIDTSIAATFTINIPPPTVELSVNTTTGTEAGTTAITLTATAQGAVFGNQTLNLALTGTASNSDFSSTIPAQITIADGSNSGQVTLTVANDFIDEDDETATFTISNPSGGIQLGTTTAQTVTITDDDTAGYDITTISGDTSEFASLATFDISLTSQPTAPVTLNFASSDTTEGTVIPSVTFDATNWNIPQTVTITGVDDLVADNNITYNITSTATSSDPKYNNNNPPSVTVINTDNDIPGVTVIQSSGNTELTEGGITDSYTIQLNTLPTGNVQITATADPQTEISLDGVNFAPTQNLTFTNVNGTTPQTVTVRAINDTTPEDYHSGNITHTISNSADANYPTTMTVGDVNPNITDNDISYTLTGSSPTVTEGNSGTQQITYNITRAGAINETSNVDFNFSGTGANTIDYNLISITGIGVTTSGSTIAFAANATQSTITVEVVGDQIDEDEETLEINLVNPTASGTASVTGSPATTTITDDDTAGVTITPTSGLTTTEAGGTSSFDVHLTSQPTANVTINLSSSNTAEGTIDKPSLTFTAANWNTPQTVTVNGVDELVDDGNIAYNIITAAATSADAKYNGMNADDIAVTNIDDDTAGVTITQTGGTTQLTEGSITDTYTIALDTLPTGNVQITATADAQTQVSLDGVNFAASQTLTFTPTNGMMAQTVTVRAINDNTTENLHSGTITNAITTSADTNYATTMTLDGITGNITDNDISYTLTGSTTTITEGNSGTQQLTYNITRAGALNETSTVDFNFSGTATNIADYKLVSITGTGVSTTNSTITFAPNATSATVTVEIVGDQIDEDDETLEINLVNPRATGTATVIGSPVTTTITDDDTAGFTVTPTSGLTTTEAGGTATFTVALNSQPTADITINLSSDNMAEGIFDKPSLTFNAATWNTAQTVTVMGVDDLGNDGDIFYNIITAAATSTDTKYNGINPVDVAVTNTDNDTAGVSLSTESLSVYEGGNAGYSIVLTSAPTAPVTINFNTDSQLIAPPPITFDIYNWNQPQTVTVTAVDDVVAAGNPASIITHTITSADASYNGVNVGTVAANITDNDTAGLLVVLPVGSGDVIEGGGEDIYKLLLTQPPTADVVVSISGDSQVMVNTPSLTFTPSNWNQAQVWRSAAVDDGIVEGGHQGNISFAITSGDGIYNQVAVAPLSINIADNDNVGMETSLPTASGVAGTDADDKIVGSAGADLVYGRGGTNQLNGGAGDDILYGGNGADDITGGVGLDQIFGDFGADYLAGDGDDDVIFGGGGNDRIFGGSGNDLLSGDEGNDYLFGDAGVDTLTGGTGRDAFAVGNGSGGMMMEMADVITDFVSGEDVIDLMSSLGFADLSVVQNGADAVMQNRVTGEFLALVQGVDTASLTQADFG
ncbi:MAG TPA: DUF4347 domain-containing protein [Oscillatoriaceae cyanobacterium M33_DOE_052]|uniref:DUF4347 domain-containing protein n=1 Tax=Planktothricoides sp. SpSt-374 TaxID=2282167 RepID=A0A7C3ZUC3_9CYAN|nr:DUF4347 domain-containing protein [Oscillatoriaceae cyanobacterium M33_DOE_052]